MTPDEAREKAIEAMARAMCEFDDVDPEHICYGVGRIVPDGERWPAWKVRQKIIKAVLPAYGAAMLDAGWKMTPREMTEGMRAAYRGSAIDPESDWEPVWDATPTFTERGVFGDE